MWSPPTWPGDTTTGKAVLRDLVNVTVRFEALAQAINKPRTFAPPRSSRGRQTLDEVVNLGEVYYRLGPDA